MNVALAALIWLLSWLLAAPGEASKIKESYPSFDQIVQLRERFLLALSGYTADSKGLVAGLTIGLRDGISVETADHMKTLSLTHLVAVSGANLAIVLASIYFLIGWSGAPRWLRFTAGLFGMCLYVLLVGPESSVIRAATMATFVMIGLWLGRGSSALNSLALAVILLLTLDPALSTDIGFALSAFATAGLLILAPPVFEFLRQRMPDIIALGVAASFSAQLFTTPVLLLLQPSIPIYSVLANVLVEPVVAPITILGILSVLASVVNLQLAAALSLLASVFAQWIVFVANELSEWPEARVHFVRGELGIALVVLIVLCLALSYGVLKRQAQILQVTAAALTLFAVAVSATDRIRFETFAGDWDLIACDVNQGDAVLLRSAGQVALIDVGPDPELVDRCLNNAGVTHIDLLVLTHFDADHVGGIEGALNHRSLGIALVSGFEDDRPLVSKVESVLQRKQVTPVLARAGVQGRLGELNWMILQPSATAAEAEDSNDASIVITAWGESWAFLGLGDLGESGQNRLLRQSSGILSQLRELELVVKVAHHGSADQSAELAKFLAADYSLFLVGRNSYGHPTPRAIGIQERFGAQVLRTDQLGPIALEITDRIRVLVGGKLST